MNNPTVSRMVQYILRYKKLMAGAVAGALLSVPLGLLGPVLVGRAVDGIIGQGYVDFALVLQTLVLLGVSAGGAALLQWLMLVCTRKISANAAQDMRREAFENLSKVPLARIDTHRHGDIVSRLVNDADAVSEGFLQALSQLVPGIVTIVATIIVMLLLNVPIALVVIVATPLSIVFARFVASRTSKMFRAQTQAQGLMSGYINEIVNNQSLVRSMGSEKLAEQAFAGLADEYYDANFKATFYSSVSNPGTRFVNALVYSAVGVFGAFYAMAGHITIGGLSVFLSYANQYTKPFNEVTSVLTQMQSAVASAERLFEVMDWQPQPADAEGAIAPAHCEGKVLAQDVYFAYTPSRPLIRGFDLHVKPGQRIALVGPTGCGKTTLINLLMRFYEVDSGEISVDGVPIQGMQRNALRRLYGMVLQETWLKMATVRENIAYACPSATQQEVEQAAKAAYAHSFIKRLPQGYDTVITPGGGNLSAGQKQLLCIARIMLAKPDMLILDEATSSIDTRTEMRIQKALERLMVGHTSFIVAHRLSTIQNADSIVVMNAGRIVEKGTHQQLLQANGFYAKLYASQFKVE